MLICSIGLSSSLGGLFDSGQMSTNGELVGMRSEMMIEVRNDIADLQERTAHLEGFFEGRVNREAELKSTMSAAVWEGTGRMRE